MTTTRREPFDPAAEREKRIVERIGKCKHFTGLQNKTCEAGAINRLVLHADGVILHASAIRSPVSRDIIWAAPGNLSDIIDCPACGTPTPRRDVTRALDLVTTSARIVKERINAEAESTGTAPRMGPSPGGDRHSHRDRRAHGPPRPQPEETPMTHSPPLAIAEDNVRNFAIAEALGAVWFTKETDSRRELVDVSNGYVVLARIWPDGEVATMSSVRYSSDPVAFEALLGEIGRRGLGEKYVRELARLTWTKLTPREAGSGNFIAYDVWALLSAPQSTKAQACLAVLRESREAKNG